MRTAPDFFRQAGNEDPHTHCRRQIGGDGRKAHAIHAPPLHERNHASKRNDKGYDAAYQISPEIAHSNEQIVEKPNVGRDHRGYDHGNKKVGVLADIVGEKHLEDRSPEQFKQHGAGNADKGNTARNSQQEPYELSLLTPIVVIGEIPDQRIVDVGCASLYDSHRRRHRGIKRPRRPPP